ncbi:hypothetical protein KCU81_g682, partial [Aureobasidium melanogenum]
MKRRKQYKMPIFRHDECLSSGYLDMSSSILGISSGMRKGFGMTSTHCRFNLFIPSIGCHCDDWYMADKLSFFFEFSNLPRTSQSVHNRHLLIHKDDAQFNSFRFGGDGLATMICDMYNTAQVFQLFGKDSCVHDIVFNDLGLATELSALALTTVGTFLPVASLAVRTAGRFNPSASGGALLRFALTQKAKPRTSVLYVGSRGGLRETQEEHLLLLLIESTACVLNGKVNVYVFAITPVFFFGKIRMFVACGEIIDHAIL